MIKILPILVTILAAGPAVAVHVSAAISALFLGGFVFFSKKGTNLHKVFGKIWVGLMLVVALSSFWISGLKIFGPFSPIHLLSIFTLFALYHAVQHARAGRIDAHRKAMKNIYLFALVGAGLLTLVPGRLISDAIFGLGFLENLI